MPDGVISGSMIRSGTTRFGTILSGMTLFTEVLVTGTAPGAGIAGATAMHLTAGIGMAFMQVISTAEQAGDAITLPIPLWLLIMRVLPETITVTAAVVLPQPMQTIWV